MSSGKFVLLLVIVVGSITHGMPASAAEHTKDTLAVVKANVGQDKAVIVDVREKKEWEEGHLKEAYHLPLSRLQKGVDPKSLESDLPKSKILYTHCRAGRRSLLAAEILEDLGYDGRPLKEGTADLLKTFPAAD